MHPHYDPFGPINHHRQLMDEVRRDRVTAALRRQVRAQRLRRRADALEQHARRTFS